ncbi:MFS transporter [Camelimonas abortus]|uniref:MFS transporter n=1 Tax=Camelimonas abortus TaxID=1017184 RepID=A0ABV7LER6_9HYPH
MTSATGAAGWSDLFRGRNGALTLALAGGAALHAVNVYIAATILPSVVADIGGIDFYAWNTSLFIVASILASAASPALLRAAGPRGAYLAGAAIFGLGSAACGLAPSMPLLLAGRVVQGLGGGFLLALAYAMIRLAFAPALWPRGIALVSGMWGVATLVGPATGGAFAEYGMWRAAFWSLAPAAALFGALAAAALPGAGAARDSDGDAGAPVVQILLLAAAVLAVSAGSASTSLAWNAAGFAAGAGFTVAMAAVEKRSARRLLPSGTFSGAGALAAVYLSMMLLSVMVTSSEIFAPLFLQTLHHQTPLVAGYLAASMSAGWTVGSLTGSGATGARMRRQLRLAPLPGLAGMIALLILVPPGGAGDAAGVAPIAVALVMVGLGVGLAWPHLLTRALQLAPAGEDAVASASLTTVQLFATASGAALAGMVVNLAGLTDPGGGAGVASAAFWLFATFALAPLACLFTIRRAMAGAP